MQAFAYLATVALAALPLLILVGGCASSPVNPTALHLEQPPMTDYMRSRVGTPDELSPLAPPEARNVRKVGNLWTCEVNGKNMVYNNASGRWEAGQK
ncbi:MAG: hypothetical protein ACOZFS_04165 [Thermodesulfobacteriota bacterium]